MEIKILKSILGANETVAENNVEFFKSKNIRTANLMSSPGAGKTELLGRTITDLSADIRFGVVEGDICTTMDADRLAVTGAPIVQINTEPFGGDCHLEAGMIRAAADQMDIDSLDFIFVENVGNLVCPAEFKLGVDRNIVLLSITEGEDKPLKYPLMFQVCDLCILTKTDLLAVLDYDIALVEKNIKQVNPKIEIIRISAKSGDGLDNWYKYLRSI